MNFLRKPFPLLGRSISSMISPPKLHPSSPLFSRSFSNPNLYSIKKLFSAGRIPNPSSQWRRFFHLDRDQPQHWYRNPRAYLIIAVGSGAILTIYFGHFETVPCSNRSHFILISHSIERNLGENQFEDLKNDFKGKILPANHPDSVRVHLIANNIIKALQRALHHDRRQSGNLGYGSEVPDPEKSKETRKNVAEVQSSRSVPQMRHLEGLHWEVLVVRDNAVNAFCLPGGKIVVFTGLLHHLRTDAEIAAVLGHEVAHVIARHGAETITKSLGFVVIRLILRQFFDISELADVIIDSTSNLLLQLPFSRRMETEADYVGLLLMSSAGYDPRVAPRVYEKLGQTEEETLLDDYISTHPSSKKRAKMLSQAQVMEKALSLYGDAVAGHVVSGFL